MSPSSERKIPGSEHFTGVARHNGTLRKSVLIVQICIAHSEEIISAYYISAIRTICTDLYYPDTMTL